MDDLANLIDVAKTERSRQKRLRVHCCTSTGCRAASSEAVLTSLQDTIKTEGLGDEVEAIGVGCMGFCGRGPLVEIEPSAWLDPAFKGD